MTEPKWGPTGKDVYERTYSRTKADGTKETWRETVERVVDGNLSLVDRRFVEDGEREQLIDAIYNFRIIPAGRHLWMSGVEGRQFLFNCYVAGWGDSLSDHFTFTFNQLMEGGGVGSNYSEKYVHGNKYPIFHLLDVHIVCSDEHDDYTSLFEFDLLSRKYSSEYTGAFEVEDSREGWTAALKHLIDTATSTDGDSFKEPKTVVFDVSNIRSSGKRIKTFGGTSAGPVPLSRMLTEVSKRLNDAWECDMSGPIAMEIDHAIAECVVSGNVRRSARMSIMRWDDPNILWFLECKRNGLSHWSTNISVEIDNEFINLLKQYDSGILTPKNEQAMRVYYAIVEGMLTNGEPGIWNSSLANIGEPNPVIATNPCGEICLEEWENCNLGHVNLDAFVQPNGTVAVKEIAAAHQLMTRFLIRATFGDISDSNTRAIVDRNRRIGVGHLGFAGYLAKRGIKFSEATDRYKVDITGLCSDVQSDLTFMRHVVNKTAIEYAHQLRIPVPVKTTTVAPTGTVAKMPGRSEGIHPVYARYFIRRIRYSMVDPDQLAKIDEFRNLGYNVVEDIYAPNTWVVEIPTKEALVEELEELGIDSEILESVDEISLKDAIAVQAMYQEYYADNAVSFTVNIPKEKYSVEEVMKILLPNLSRLKGTTIMVDESRELAPYERITEEEYLQSTVMSVDASYDEECASGACPIR